MGFAGLILLSSVVKATIGLRWEQEGSMADILAVVDTDICQAIQVRFGIQYGALNFLIDVTRVVMKSSMEDV